MDINELVARAQAADIRSVRFLYCDHANIVRGKSAHAAALADCLESGIGLVVAMQAFTLTERLAGGSHLGPFGEIRLVPDPRTFAVLPYSPREARLLCDMHTLDGRPWELCPRAFLIDMVDRAGQQGLRVEAAFEYEFYLARQLDDGRYVPADDSLCFSSDGMDRQAAVIGAIMDALEQQNLEPRQYYPELGPGQQELSIQHAPMLQAADRQIAVRETVRAVTLQHGLTASFAPKPFADQAGNGCHVHMSLWNGDRNALYDASASSGRIEASTNVEIKAVDGSANPYLALGAIVAAGLDGMQRGLDPGEPVQTNPHDMDETERQARGIRRYPTTLAEALTELEQDEVLLNALGSERAHEFISVRRAEWDDLGHLSTDRQIATHFRRY